MRGSGAAGVAQRVRVIVMKWRGTTASFYRQALALLIMKASWTYKRYILCYIAVEMVRFVHHFRPICECAGRRRKEGFRQPKVQDGRQRASTHSLAHTRFEAVKLALAHVPFHFEILCVHACTVCRCLRDRVLHQLSKGHGAVNPVSSSPYLLGTAR